jgi:hypothetical protein
VEQKAASPVLGHNGSMEVLQTKEAGMAKLHAELEVVEVRQNHLVLAVHMHWMPVMENKGSAQEHHFLVKEAMSFEEGPGADPLVAVEGLVLTAVESQVMPLLVRHRGFAGWGMAIQQC